MSFVQRYRSSLTLRFIVHSVALLMLVQLVSVLLIDRAIDVTARKRVAEQLAFGERALQSLLAQSTDHLVEEARLLAADYGFREAVLSGDAPTIGSALDNHRQRIGAVTAALYDRRFGRLADSDTGRPATAVVEALAAQSVRGDAAPHLITLHAGVPTVFVLAPVKAPTTIAWVLLGFPLDARLGDALRHISGLHVALLVRPTAQGHWVAQASTLAAPLAAHLGEVLDERPAPTGALGSVRLGVEEFSARLLPIARDDVAPGEAVSMMLLSVDAAVAHYRRLRWALGALTMLGVAAFTIGSVVTARRLTTPLRRLADRTEALARGHYGGPVDGQQRSDEIGHLARCFEHLREGLASMRAEILDLAHRDRLTGLPNRHHFREAVTEAMRANEGAGFAVLMIDLDRFRHVNDVLGWHCGDRLLKAVADSRLRPLLRPGVIAARLGGDQFALLLRDTGAAAAEAQALRLAAEFERSIELDEHRLDLGAGIGIACWPTDGDDVDQLLAHAEMALTVAKRRNGAPVLYDAALAARGRERLSLLSELRHALEHGEFRLFLQPKLALASGRLVGAEVLLRWQHPARGLVPPGEFIPFAEQTGFIRQLTLWVFAAAAQHWRALGADGAGLRLAVNLSTRDLQDPALPDKLVEILERLHVPADAFCLEITESAIMEEPTRAEATLQRLAAAGFHLAIDDFGTGYSSLTYLKRLPVDELKIDRSFVMALDRDADDEVIVRSTIDLAHNLGLSVVAEGVEHAAVLERLRALGCDEAQGYHIGRPMPIADFERWRAASADAFRPVEGQALAARTIETTRARSPALVLDDAAPV